MFSRAKRHGWCLLPLAAAALLAAGTPANAAFSGQNGKITFTSSNRIFTINSDGSGATQLTFGFPSGNHGNPAFSPDGTRIAFDAGKAIWVMDADGTNLGQLTTGAYPTFDGNPHWLPSGQIIFERENRSDVNTDGFYDKHLYRIDVDGSNPTALTTTEPASNRDPATNSAGTVVYAANGNGGGLDIFSLGGGNLTNTAAGNGTDRESRPDVAPNGDVAYTNITVEGASAGPKVMILGGGVIAGAAADGAGGAGDPAFSPDGSKIVYDGNSGLRIMNPDGSGKTRITGPDRPFTGSGDQPNWGVVPAGPAADRDGDGVPDASDTCPDQDASGKDVDGDGCIDQATPPADDGGDATPTAPPADAPPTAALPMTATSSSGPTGSTPLLAQPALPAPDTTKPKAKLSAVPRSIRLREAAARGLSLVITPREDVTARLEIFLAPKAARKVGLAAARTRIAKGSRAIAANTSGRVVARLTRKAKARLRRARSLRLQYRITLIDRAGNRAAPKELRVTLKR